MKYYFAQLPDERAAFEEKTGVRLGGTVSLTKDE